MAIGAVDIGGTKIAVGIIDATGKVLGRAETPTEPAAGFEAAMTHVSALFDELCARTGVTLAGIGIGCTGPVDPRSGEIGEVDFLPGWRGCNPVRWLGDRRRLGVAMENDADAAALGELAFGAGRGKQTLISVTVGTGIGGGLVLNGRLYRGVDGAHPELGHHVIDASGPACYCGARGCWEVLARGPAMPERLLAVAPADYPHRHDLSARRVCELARAGDALALSEVAREGEYLGIGIANLVTLYAPEMIVLSGSVMDSADLFLPAIRAVVRRNCGLVPAARVGLQLSALGGDAPLVGASVVWQQQCETMK